MHTAHSGTFAVDDAAAAQDVLITAGATCFSPPETLASGDQLAMLRDPFGLALQFVYRKSPLIGNRA